MALFVLRRGIQNQPAASRIDQQPSVTSRKKAGSNGGSPQLRMTSDLRSMTRTVRCWLAELPQHCCNQKQAKDAQKTRKKDMDRSRDNDHVLSSGFMAYFSARREVQRGWLLLLFIPAFAFTLYCFTVSTWLRTRVRWSMAHEASERVRFMFLFRFAGRRRRPDRKFGSTGTSAV